MKKILKKNQPKETTNKYDITCFLISPIGTKGSEHYNRFKEVLDYVIRPAVEESNFNLKVVRADEINKPGSIIKDILESLIHSNIVIADLTTQNPNVFYELGVRHSLSPRTILISQSESEIPFDLRDYRTIIYDTSAKGSSDFKKKLTSFLEEINKNPNTTDNPILDRFESIVEKRAEKDRAKILELESLLEKLVSDSGIQRKKVPTNSKKSIQSRLDRILKLRNASKQFGTSGESYFTRTVESKEIKYYLPDRIGSFRLYFFLSENNQSIEDFYYVMDILEEYDEEDILADIRILLQKSSKDLDVYINIAIILDYDQKTNEEILQKKFSKILKFIPAKKRNFYFLEVWDNKSILQEEKRLGIKV
ncbi:hypothetical protein NUH30_19090 [Leptospira sp. 85282-16]|uniref:hypothetical protein n=1 Tax=Leptospira sp. 85282-16 TaxID=2971256 RepID=UPI0021BFE6EA|nr:hypothetical protein [Leptospira sp. 85282-16]MCT8335800.1 hypothetical protein [Leptospira sp. 85282-16]